MRWHLVLGLILCAIAGGCGNDVIPDVVLDGATEDANDDATTSTDASADGIADDTSNDTTVVSDTNADTSVSDAKPSDGTTADVSVDVGPTMLSCGTESCNPKTQFCHRDTSPGICPAPDSGICPAGCAGCPPLGMHCETLPAKCAAAPDCMCLVGAVCMFSGACDSKGGFTVGCKGI